MIKKEFTGREPKPNADPERIPNDVWHAHQICFSVPPNEFPDKWKKFIEIHGRYKRGDSGGFLKDAKGKFILKENADQLKLF